MKNPFVTNGYAGAEYFCDRVQETASLRELLLNENNVALISPRRLGKTDLIWHVFNDAEIRRTHYCFVVDIYATKNLGDFVNMLGKAVMDELRPKGKRVWEMFIKVVSSLRSEISFDMNGLPTWSVGLGAINNPAWWPLTNSSRLPVMAMILWRPPFARMCSAAPMPTLFSPAPSDT